GAGGAGGGRGGRRGHPRRLRRRAPARRHQGIPRRAGKRLMAVSPSVAVVGGGIIGCACALELARRGCTVTLFERGAPGGEASGAAAGLLSPLGSTPDPGPFHR